MYKRPDSMWGDRLKRNQSKYCRYNRDVGHTTKECITFKDEIEKLIRERYLRDNVRNECARPQNDHNEVRPPREIRTIFDRPHFTGEMRGPENRYLRETKKGLITTASSLEKWPAK